MTGLFCPCWACIAARRASHRPLIRLARRVDLALGRLDRRSMDALLGPVEYRGSSDSRAAARPPSGGGARTHSP